MTSEDLKSLILDVVKARSEYQDIELKAAKKGCPEKLYDSLSSFSNSDTGGILLFGIDEKNDYALCGVYDLQELQQRIAEQCEEMSPKIRPLLSHTEINQKYYLSAEIPSVDIAERPCFYTGRGRLKGSYIRVGTNDVHMTEYEIYSYEAYRKKYQDDIRAVPRATNDTMDLTALSNYVKLLTDTKPNLARLDEKQIMNLMSLTVNEQYSLTSCLLFGLYPQAFFPQLCMIATAYPGTSVGSLGSAQERFTDNQRIEGTIPQILSAAVGFVKKNIRTKTIIDPETAQRKDISDYPLTAVREVILNALVHRDYSIHTEGKPIQLQIFPDRIVVTSPGGLYGRLRIDQLGKMQPDTRNPVLATALEVLKITENRYSGIPTIRKEMKDRGLPMPVFEDNKESFLVTLFGERTASPKPGFDEKALLSFCTTPRSREEIANYLGITTVAYAMSAYVVPLIESGKIFLSNPAHPKSPSQQYCTKPNP